MSKLLPLKKSISKNSNNPKLVFAKCCKACGRIVLTEEIKYKGASPLDCLFTNEKVEGPFTVICPYCDTENSIEEKLVPKKDYQKSRFFFDSVRNFEYDWRE